MLKQDTSSIPGWYVLYKKFIAFIRTSFILQLFFILTIVLFIYFVNRFYLSGKILFSINTLFIMFFFSLSVTTQLDAYSRYQNYKLIKDMMHKNGYRSLIIKPFSRSRCQRDAVREAAHQLELQSMVKQYFYETGYRWYHIMPSVLLQNPFLIFTKGYWITTFFVPRYVSKYFLW